MTATVMIMLTMMMMTMIKSNPIYLSGVATQEQANCDGTLGLSGGEELCKQVL